MTAAMTSGFLLRGFGKSRSVVAAMAKGSGAYAVGNAGAAGCADGWASPHGTAAIGACTGGLGSGGAGGSGAGVAS